MDFNRIQTGILLKLKEVQQEKIMYDVFYENVDKTNGINEFLFFIKPEITVCSKRIQFPEILKLIFNKIREFDFTVKDIRILSARYLADNNIIAQHYGVINKLANNPLGYFSEDAKNKFQDIFDISVENANITGSFEFLNNHHTISAEALDYLCQNTVAKKLAGGTYINRLKMDGQDVFLVNGFHPRQIEHFTAKGKSIIAFTLAGDTKWSVARNDFTGKTNPFDANKGSIRNELLVNSKKLGLTTVSSSWNGVHLSAGPVEGLVELMRYNSDFSKNIIKAYTDFTFGSKLAEVFTESKISDILANTNVRYNQKNIPVFDLTEEIDSHEAIEFLKKTDPEIQ